jgi:hypothetical protein
MTSNPAPEQRSIPELEAEVERLRSLVGPDEKSYADLQVDLLGARDAAIGARAEVGVLEGRIAMLETEVVRARRDFAWLRPRLVRWIDSIESAASRCRGVVRRRVR